MSTRTTQYLNQELIESIDAKAFQQRDPFPWINPHQFIRADRFEQLLDELPPIEQFRSFFGKQRKHGQGSHDRYVLDYEDGMTLSPGWDTLLAEMRGPVYRGFICRLLNVSDVRFRFHWHYTPGGAEVTPHCDSKGKIGSQIFYCNRDSQWDYSWGGETVVLDDGGRIAADNNPAFSDFDAEYPAATHDNRSLIFGRRGNSWHGVRKLTCPEGYYRKVFIVVFEEHRPLKMASKKLKRLVTGKPLVTHKESLMY